MGDIYIAFSDGKNKYYDNFDVKIRNGIPNEKLVIGRVVIPNPRLIRGDYPFDVITSYSIHYTKLYDSISDFNVKIIVIFVFTV